MINDAAAYRPTKSTCKKLNVRAIDGSPGKAHLTVIVGRLSGGKEAVRI